jgi:hypothetical protein
MEEIERLVLLVEQARTTYTYLLDMSWSMVERGNTEGADAREYEGGPTWFDLYLRYAHVRDRAEARLKRRSRALRRAAPRSSMARRRAVKLAEKMRTEGKMEF